MSSEYVIGIDSSTQSTKAIAWTRDGKLLGEGRSPVELSNPRDGYLEQDPENWWQSCSLALKDLGNFVSLNNAAGIAISNQRETVAFVDKNGDSIRPAIIWLDERAKDLVQPFTELVHKDEIHRITGKPVDVTPVLYRLYWMYLNEPNLLKKTAKILDVHSYLAGKLTSDVRASWTSADPFGIFDINTKEWSKTILDPIGISDDQLPQVVKPGKKIGIINSTLANQIGLKSGIPLIAAGGDGQCAGLGVNAINKGTAYVSLGTGLVVGTWNKSTNLSKYWRTLCSPTGNGYFLEGVVRAGTYFIDWFVKNFINEHPTSEIYQQLESEASSISIGSDGLTISPYLSGCMNPYWSMDMRATFFGLKSAHSHIHLYRGILESLTGAIARTLKEMDQSNVKTQQIFVVGGGSNSKLWLQMLSDSTGIPIRINKSPEASALGAGITAATGIGWFPDFHSATESMCQTGKVITPVESNKSKWDILLRKQEQLDDIVIANNELSNSN